MVREDSEREERGGREREIRGWVRECERKGGRDRVKKGSGEHREDGEERKRSGRVRERGVSW